MLSIINEAFDPSVSYPDKITYMTSVIYLQSVRGESNTASVIDKIKGLLASRNTRLCGLQFLEIALNQNKDVYMNGRWTPVLYDILNEPVCSILKEHVCKIFCILIPLMVKDANQQEVQKFVSVLFPSLLAEVENDVEWVESAGMCLAACLKWFPQALEPHRDRLLRVIYKQISQSVSSKTFEVFAECFSYIPNCPRHANQDEYAEFWTNQYLTTLNTMHYMLNIFLRFMNPDPYSKTSIPDIGVFPFVHDDDGEDVYSACMKRIRRFLNLSKCLSKMLSTKTKYPVQVPIKLTLGCISRLFRVQELAKIQSFPIDVQITISNLTQMQLASLVVLESLGLNLNILSFTYLIAEIMLSALQSSKLSNLNKETVCPVRHAVWSFLDQFVSLNGAKAVSELLKGPSLILEELLHDIEIRPESKTNNVDKCQASTSKSNKNIALNTERKPFVNKSQQAVCKKALKTLETFLYSGARFFHKISFQEITDKVKSIAFEIAPQHEFPLLYDDHMCRKNLYSVLLALAVVSKIDDREPIQYTIGIFKRALLDPSAKVVRLCHKAMAMCRLYLHPRRPVPLLRDYDSKTKRVSNALADARYTEWATDDYLQNLPPVENVSNVSENASPRIVHTYQNPNEGEITPDEYMQQDAHYSEQASENQCNGEDILEMQNSSHGQDDDSEEEEDDDEDEEQSYGDEEMNQEVEMQDHLYIPSTSKSQAMNSVPVASDAEQNVEAQDYEELRPRGNSEDKNSNLNGVGNNVIDEEMPSPSVQNVTSENGIYDGYEDEDLDEEEGDEDEEEEGAGYPGEKRVPEYLEAPATKKQKIEEAKEEERMNVPKDNERTRTPTLEEMKADFVCDLEEAKS